MMPRRTSFSIMECPCPVSLQDETLFSRQRAHFLDALEFLDFGSVGFLTAAGTVPTHIIGTYRQGSVSGTSTVELDVDKILSHSDPVLCLEGRAKQTPPDGDEQGVRGDGWCFLLRSISDQSDLEPSRIEHPGGGKVCPCMCRTCSGRRLGEPCQKRSAQNDHE